MNARADEPPVSLEDYAFVTAGTSDGLELLELLEHRAVDPTTWPHAEMYWLERLMDDLMGGKGELSLRLGELQAEARASWVRPIPPLDEELAAWVSWSQRLSEQAEPQAWLAEQGLEPIDLLHLQKLWTRRLAEDEALRKEHAELLTQPPQPVEVPRPAPLTLPRSEDKEVDLDGTAFARTLSDEEVGGSMPFESQPPAAPKGTFRVAPDLLSPVPAPAPEQNDVDATGHIDLSVLGASLPFFQGASEPGQAHDDAPAPARESPELPSPPPAAPPDFAPAPLPMPAPMPGPVVITSSDSMDHTAVGGVPVVSDEVLPFAGEAPPPPSVSGELSPSPDMGSTAFVSVLDLGTATPFEGGDDDVDSTLVGGVATMDDALPFSGESAPPPVKMLPPAAPTGTVFVSQPKSDAPPLPFVKASGTEPLLVAGGLTLRQLASLTVEMELSYTQIAALLSAYGLTLEILERHNVARRELVDRDPTAQGRWDEAVAAYRAWRTQG